MWGQLVRLLAPIAVRAMADRMRTRTDASGRQSRALDGRPGDLDTRLVDLENQVDLQARAQTKQMDDLATALRLVSVRVTIAIWLSIASLVVTLIFVMIAIFKL